MKRILISALLWLCVVPAVAQDEPDYLTTPPVSTPFARSNSDRPAIEPGRVTLTFEEMDALILARPDSVLKLGSIETFTDNLEFGLDFRRVEVFAPGSRIRLLGFDGEIELPRDPRQFFIAANESTGIGLAVNSETGEVNGFASKYGQPMTISGNLVGQLEFKPVEETEAGSNFCGTEMKDQPLDALKDLDSRLIPSASESPMGAGISFQATVAIDTDTEWLDGFGDDTVEATEWITDIFLAMNVFYERDVETRLLIGDVTLRTGTDPYTITGAGKRPSQLEEFGGYWMDNMDGVERQFAAMFSGRDIPPGWFSGIAWINAYCDNGRPRGVGASGSYSYNAIGTGRSAADTALFVGHELGHNMGSVHTHCYSPPVDKCYGEGGGSCYSGAPECPVSGKGSVMSYCHNLGGCGSLQEFHPTVQSLLESRLASQNAAGCIATYEDVSPEPEFGSSPPAGSLLNFGDQLSGELSDPTLISIDNTGASNLTVSCALSGDDPTSFRINTCPAVLLPLTGQDLSLGCEPVSAGLKQALLTLTTNDSDEGTVTYDLRCNGVDPAEPEFVSNPAAGALLNFGDQLTGEPGDPLLINVSNTGNADLTVACGLSGDDPTSFTINSCQAVVSPLANADLSFACEAASEGLKQAVLTLTTNDGDEGTVTYDLQCNGVEPIDPGLIFKGGFEQPPT